jgi:hypothetical protein
LIVRSRSGAKLDECKDGSGVPFFIASSYFAGSTAPTRKRTDGTPAALPNSPKSSATISGRASTTFSAPSAPASAEAIRRVTTGSL